MHIAVANRLSPEAEAMIQYLADKGAKLDARDDKDKTPADFVNSNGPERIRVFYVQLAQGPQHRADPEPLTVSRPGPQRGG